MCVNFGATLQEMPLTATVDGHNKHCKQRNEHLPEVGEFITRHTPYNKEVTSIGLASS